VVTVPEDIAPEPTRVERIRKVALAPIAEKSRPVTLLAISAGLATLAPVPFGGLAVVLLVLVAADSGRRR